MSDNPIKIIWKYKNSNKRIQYNTYIFVGNMVSKDIMNILNDIKEILSKKDKIEILPLFLLALFQSL